MSQVFKTDDKLKSYFRPGDLFLLDIGLRDVIPELEQMNYEIFMPVFLEKGQKQLSDIQANKSRFCTKVRGIVERVFGSLQQHFPYFAKGVSNRTLKHDFTDFLNVCAIYNEYFPRLNSDVGREIEMSKNYF